MRNARSRQRWRVRPTPGAVGTAHILIGQNLLGRAERCRIRSARPAVSKHHERDCRREKELRVITDKLLEPAPGSLRAKLEELREFAVSRLSKVRELLARPENIQEAHEALAERVGQLTLEATNNNGKRTYLAHGKVDFFGEEELAHSDGAGGPVCTTRATDFSFSLAA
jgi:hypothetical protein